MYAALDPDTMWAEWARATSGRVAAREEERAECAVDVDLRVLDLRSPATREALGVTLDELVADWAPDAPNRACLLVARAAHDGGADGYIVPSAAHPGGWNLAVLPSAFDRVRVVRRSRAKPPRHG